MGKPRQGLLFVDGLSLSQETCLLQKIQHARAQENHVYLLFISIIYCLREKKMVY